MKLWLPNLTLCFLALALNPKAIAQTASWTAFGSGCSGAAGVPILAPAGFDQPFVGDVFTTELSNLPMTGVGVGFLGLSDRSWGGIQLPADLAPLLPGCSLFVEGRFTTSLTIAGGRAYWDRLIPNRAELHGLNFYQQALILDDTVPGIGAIMSNAGHGVVENFSGPLSIEVLGGLQGSTPQAGVRVLRHDPGTGAVLADLLTDQNGIADFGIIRSARTTFTIVDAPASPGDEGELLTFMDVDVGELTILAGPRPASQADFNVRMTNTPINVDAAFVRTGAPGVGESFEPIVVTPPTITVVGVEIPHLQNDGLFSFITEVVRDTDGTSRCGLLLDVDPATVSPGSTLIVATSDSGTNIPFSANVPVEVDRALIRRKGLLYETGYQTSPNSFGGFTFCPLPDTDKYAFFFGTRDKGVVGIGFISDVLPGSFLINIPILGMTNLARDVSTERFSWSLEGTDVSGLDLTELTLQWDDFSSSSPLQWTLSLPAESKSVTLPDLPQDLALFMPPQGISYRIESTDLDIATGYQDLMRKVSDAGGSLVSALLTGTEVASVSEVGF